MNLHSLNLFTAEALEIHRLCDKADVPREADDERWTMSQRVAYLVGQNQGWKLATEAIATARAS